jgi:FAD/FMN-containing dehydrogenase
MPSHTANAIAAAVDEQEWIVKVRGLVRGQVITSCDENYETERRVYNARIDRRPAAIVKCAGVSDVMACVGVANEFRSPLCIRASGHSAAGFGVCDGGLTIDVSRMKGIRVDPVRRRVRAEAGVTWGELDRETQAFGLATTGARISTTGIAGVTLGGGYGWLMRKHGLAVDNLVSCDIVTANQQLLTVSETENADLFWGLRGGGGNFGVVTSFEYRLHPVGPIVTGGMCFYAAEQVKELLCFYREFMASAPDEITALFNFLIAPAAPFIPSHLRGRLVAAIAVCHSGSVEDAQRDLDCLSRVGPPLLTRIKPRPYMVVQKFFDAAGAFGNRAYGRSGHLTNLSDQVIEKLVSQAHGITSPLSIVMISSLGGAVARVGEHDTAFSRRATAFDLAINSVWEEGDNSDRHIRWTEDFWRAIGPSCEGVYVNELGDDAADRVREAYNPATYARLRRLKETYDPENCFRINGNIT